MCALQSGHIPFLAAVSPSDSAFAKSISVAQMLLTPKWVSRQKDVKFFFHRYIKTKSILSAAEQRFLLTPIYLVEEAKLFLFFAP